LVAVAGVAVAFFLAAGAPGPTVVLATFEVNPAFTIAVDAEGRVVELIALDAQAARLFDDVDVAGMGFDDALRTVTGTVAGAGYLAPQSIVSVAVRPAQDAGDADARRIAARIEDALRMTPDHARVFVATLSSREFGYLEDRGLLPGDYVALVADGATIEEIRTMVVARGWSDPDSVLAKEVFAAFMESANEMVESGVAHDQALALLDTAIAVRLDADDLTEITAVHEELIDSGVAPHAALGLLRNALDAGLGVDHLWDVADVHEALAERGLPPARAQELIEQQIAEGWDAEAADEYADRLEARWNEERRESGEDGVSHEDDGDGDDSGGLENEER
jgi:hypothetical protein